MKQKDKPVGLYIKTETANAYNEIVKTWTYSKDIDMVLSCTTAVTAVSNDRYETVFTYVGLTDDSTVSVEDKIQSGTEVYLVKTIIETGRRRMCSLERVEAV